MFWYSKHSYVQLETTMQRLRKFELKVICGENFRRNFERIFYYCQDLKMAWLEHFPKFDKWGVWNKNDLGENFLKINRDLRVRNSRILVKIFYRLLCSYYFQRSFSKICMSNINELIDIFFWLWLNLFLRVFE